MAGIEALRRPPYGQAYSHPHQAHHAPAQNKSPFVAALFALVPGLGAAYNGQPVKALCHFLLPTSLWQLASLLNGLPAFAAACGGVVLYLFSLFDAWQTAQRARASADLPAEDARIKTWLQNKIHVWGTLLIGIGALTLLDQLAPHLVQRAWPLMLMLAGVWLVRDYFKRAAPHVVEPPAAAYPPRPVSFMATGMTTGLPSNYDRAAEPESSKLLNAENRFNRWG